MGHLTAIEAKAIGIGDDFCGTVSLTDMMAAKGGRARSKNHSDETKRRQAKERQGTAEFLAQIKYAGLPEPRSLFHPMKQFKFHPERRWRFDLAWEDVKLAVELQGFGSHTSAKGLIADTEKFCEAAKLGWTVLPMLYKHVRDGRALGWVEAVYDRLSERLYLSDATAETDGV
jgi:hypothetical protein